MMTWHEDREITPGVPDLHYVMKNADHPWGQRVGWIELKALDKQLTPSQKLCVEPSQLQYIRRWRDYMPIHFLVRIQERVYVIPGKYADNVARAQCRADLAIIADIQFDVDQMEEMLPPFLREQTRI